LKQLLLISDLEMETDSNQLVKQDTGIKEEISDTLPIDQFPAEEGKSSPETNIFMFSEESIGIKEEKACTEEQDPLARY